MVLTYDGLFQGRIRKVSLISLGRIGPLCILLGYLQYCVKLSSDTGNWKLSR